MAPTSKSHGAMRANGACEVTAHPPPGLRRRYRSAAARLAHRTYARNIWKHPRRRTRDHITGAMSQGLRLEHGRKRKRKMRRYSRSDDDQGVVQNAMSLRAQRGTRSFRLPWAMKSGRSLGSKRQNPREIQGFSIPIRESEDRSPARPRSPDTCACRARSPTRADRRSRNSAANARWPLFVSARPESATTRARTPESRPR